MLNIKRNINLDVTTVSNVFILKLMPKANGDYVKIYLYFLSISSLNNMSMELNDIAKMLGYTSQFIIKALLYWESIGIVEGAYNGCGELVSITFLDVNNIESDKEFDSSHIDHSKHVSTKNDKLIIGKDLNDSEEVSVITEFDNFDSIDISFEKKEELCNKDDVRMIMIAAEQYLGHTLSHSEIELFLYLYDKCGFSSDLLDYLVEYCVSKGSKSMYYIREVAFAWYKAGIDSVAKAKAATTTYHRDYGRIRRAFGIKRELGDVEIEYLNKWINEYPIDIDMVVEACNITLLNTGKAEFRYANSILKDWIAKGYANVADVHNNDESIKSKAKNKNVNKKGKTVLFQNFENRSYDSDTMLKMIKIKQDKQLSMINCGNNKATINECGEVEEDLA